MCVSGTLPGPIMLGAIIDSSCDVWQTKECGTSTGSCWVYNKEDLAIRLVVWWAGIKFVGATSYALADRFYKPVNQFDDIDMVTKRADVAKGESTRSNTNSRM